MRTSALTFFAVLLLAALSVGQDQAATSFLLKPRPKKDVVRKYKMTAEALAQDGSVLARFFATQTSKVTKIDEDGVFYIESTVSDTKMEADGHTEAKDDDNTPTTAKLGPLGELLDITGEEVGDSDFLMTRVFTFVSPKESKKVGDKWTAEVKANDKFHAPDAKVEYELLRSEEVSGAKAIAIKFNHKGTGANGVTAEGTQWVELESGALVKLEATVTAGEGDEKVTMRVKMEKSD